MPNIVYESFTALEAGGAERDSVLGSDLAADRHDHDIQPLGAIPPRLRVASDHGVIDAVVAVLALLIFIFMFNRKK